MGCELLHPVVAPVGDEDVAFPVDGDTPRQPEFARSGSFASKLGDELAVGGKLLDPVVLAVDDEHVVVGVEGHAGRAVDLTVAAALGAPLAEPFAVTVEHGDAVEPFISDVDIALAVNGDGGGPDQGAVVLVLFGFAGGVDAAGELADVVLVDRTDGDALAIGPVFVGAVDDVHGVVFTTGYGDGVTEAGAGELAAPDGVAVLEGDADSLCSHRYLARFS